MNKSILKDSEGNIVTMSGIAGFLPEGYEDITHIEIPEELQDTELRFLECIDGVISKKAEADDTKAKESIQAAVKAAISFGNELIIDFSTENVLLGITVDAMTKTVRQNMIEIISALQTGSLYDAIDEIDNFPEENKDVKYITDERLQEYKTKINNFLGI